MDISINNGVCKVISGAGRRVRYTTEEALGLALLRLNPETSRAQVEIHWSDYLAGRGVAVALSGDRILTLLVCPELVRTVVYHNGTNRQTFNVKFPPLLLATAFKAQQLIKAQLWVVKPSLEHQLSTSSETPALCYFPYGNVYGHGGICWGSTSIKDLRTPDEVLAAFFGSGFNGDLYEPGPLGERGGLLDLLTRTSTTGGVLPLMREQSFTKSVSAVAQDINRVSA